MREQTTRVFKLTTGETVIGKHTGGELQTKGLVNIYEPIAFTVVPQANGAINIQFGPYCHFQDADDAALLSAEKIVAMYVPEEKFKMQYEVMLQSQRAQRAGIHLPPPDAVGPRGLVK